MSGGASKKKSAKAQGWEEAGSEFYQESYPTTDVDFDVLQQNPKHLATLLPSKQTRAAATIRLRNNTDTRTMRRQQTIRSRRESTFRRPSTTADVQVAMMPDLSENLSNEQTTWEEIMEIKAMPVNMAQKKDMKSRLQNEPNLRLQGYEQFKWKRRKYWDHLKVTIRETYNKLELWRSTLKVIEGNFGTGVVAYFLFIKWLMFLNLLIFSAIFVFIVLPTLLINTDQSTNCTTTSTEHCCDYSYYNTTVEGHAVLDFFQGTGFMEKTHLFYGYYSNQILTYFIGSTEMYYNLPLAYILIAVLYLLVSVVAIVRAASHGFRERLVEGEGQFYQYCNLIFGGWDFCTDNEKSAGKKHEAIFKEIQNCLHVERIEEERKNRTRAEKNRLIITRTLVNFTVLVVLLACGTGIYFVFSFSTTQLNDNNSTENIPELSGDGILNLIYEFLPSICIVLLNIVMPFLFRFLVNFENYSPVFVVRITLVRTVFLRLSSLVVLLASLHSKISCTPEPGECSSRECNAPLCWETFVGQTMYKLAITDFITHIVITFLVNFPRSRIATLPSKFAKFIGEQTFDLPKHVLDVVYLQTVCWIGSFYAPLLPLMCFIICFCMFYIKKFACLVNSIPSSTVYRASRSNSLFMLVLLVSFVIAIIPIVFSVGQLNPSKSCGPFRELDTVWSVVVDAFMKMPEWIQSVVFFVSTAGFAIPAFVVLMLSLYYYTAVTSANRHMVLVLRNQLVLEGHDKQFLLDKLSLFIKQQQKRLRHTEILQEGDRNISSN